MSSIQGISSSTASYVAPKPQVQAPAAKAEVQETAQDERNEVLRGTQEAGEARPTQGGRQGVGNIVNLTA